MFKTKQTIPFVPLALAAVLSFATAPAQAQNAVDQGFIDATASAGARETGSRVQMEGLATRGAELLARRRLLEVIEGVQVTSLTTMKDMLVADDALAARVQGLLRGAIIVSEKVDWVRNNQRSIGEEPKATVTMRLCFYSQNPACRGSRARPLLSALKTEDLVPKQLAKPVLPAIANPVQPAAPAQPAQPAQQSQAPQPAQPAQPSQPTQTASANPQPAAAANPLPSGTGYTGLVITAEDEDFLPTLSPRVISSDEQAVYDARIATKKFVVRYGVAVTVNSVDNARKQGRVGDNPLVVKAATVDEDNNIVISSADATKVAAANAASGGFLKEAKVAIVVGN